MQPPIAVIGGGPAGSICARQLARLGHDVLLAERSSSSRPRVGETCGPGTRRLLEGLCSLSPPRTAYRPLTTFSSAWGSEEVDGRRFAFWQAENGLVLDRMTFDDWLLGSAEAAGVTVLRGCHVVSGRRSDKEWILSGVIDGREQTLAASFVVEATGRRTRSVVQPDAKRFFTDALVCLSVELTEQLSDDPIALVESCRTGWWYTVQVPNGKQIVALFTDADLVEPGGNRLNWLNAVLSATSHVRRLTHPLPKDARVHVCDARTSVRNVLWRNTWISIGDAAWSLDPLSGAGIERAVKDGIDAAPSISRAVISGDVEQLRVHALSRAHSFRHSLAVQRQYYGIETRWKDSIFWRRRM
ncbi:MAG: NAD(P)/FAD-dependent oxidoreductase [Egibacteraceae bacterium]